MREGHIEEFAESVWFSLGELEHDFKAFRAEVRRALEGILSRLSHLEERLSALEKEAKKETLPKG